MAANGTFISDPTTGPLLLKQIFLCPFLFLLCRFYSIYWLHGSETTKARARSNKSSPLQQCSPSRVTNKHWVYVDVRVLSNVLEPETNWRRCLTLLFEIAVLIRLLPNSWMLVLISVHSQANFDQPTISNRIRSAWPLLLPPGRIRSNIHGESIGTFLALLPPLLSYYLLNSLFLLFCLTFFFLLYLANFIRLVYGCWKFSDLALFNSIWIESLMGIGSNRWGGRRWGRH